MIWKTLSQGSGVPRMDYQLVIGLQSSNNRIISTSESNAGIVLNQHVFQPARWELSRKIKTAL
jgi:hypothetical protein